MVKRSYMEGGAQLYDRRSTVVWQEEHSYLCCPAYFAQTLIVIPAGSQLKIIIFYILLETFDGDRFFIV
jgi:hypothetical protein